MPNPARSSTNFVEDFQPRAGTFRLGIKPLNTKSVKAAQGDPNRVVRVAARHLTREIRAEADTASGRILPHLTPNNYVLAGAPSADDIETAFRAELAAAGITMPVRRDCIMAIELVFSLANDNCIDARSYFRDCLAWAQAEFKPAPIISAVVHLDEACPHLHILIAPIINGKMQGGKLCGYRGAFNRRNGHFHTVVAKKYGLARAMPKLTLSATARAAYALKIVDEIARNSSLLGENMAARKALSRLVATDPLPLGRALNLPPPGGDGAVEQQTAGVDNGTTPPTSPTPDHAADSAADAPTSSLCSDVGSGLPQPITGQSANRAVQTPVQIDCYDDIRTQLNQADDHGFKYDRDDSHPASTWVEQIGRHIEEPVAGTTNRAKADSAVAAALGQLRARRAGTVPFTAHTLPDQEVAHDD